MKVYIDAREKDKIQKVLTYFSANTNYFKYIDSMSIKTLESGDIATADGKLGIERKSPSDFISSLFKGRLHKQLYELKQNYETALLVVEGYNGMEDCMASNPQIPPTTIIGASTFSLSRFNVPIQFVGHFYEPFVCSIINKLYDGKTQRYSTDYTPTRRTATKDEHQLNIIMGIPGISKTIGKTLLDHSNNSITKLCSLSEEELTSIPGIGKKRAKLIQEILQ